MVYLPLRSHLIIDTVNRIPARPPVMRMESVRSKRPPIPSRRLSQARMKLFNTPRCALHASLHSWTL
jgi:hypothetical protein